MNRGTWQAKDARARKSAPLKPTARLFFGGKKRATPCLDWFVKETPKKNNLGGWINSAHLRSASD